MRNRYLGDGRELQVEICKYVRLCCLPYGKLILIPNNLTLDGGLIGICDVCNR